MTKWKTILSQKIKKGGFREFFLPKNGFKTCSAVNFPKQHACWRPGKHLKV